MDSRAGKNLIGTFYQPKAVLIDLDKVVRTLNLKLPLHSWIEEEGIGTEELTNRIIKAADVVSERIAELMGI